MARRRAVQLGHSIARRRAVVNPFSQNFFPAAKFPRRGKKFEKSFFTPPPAADHRPPAAPHHRQQDAPGGRGNGGYIRARYQTPHDAPGHRQQITTPGIHSRPRPACRDRDTMSPAADHRQQRQHNHTTTGHRQPPHQHHTTPPAPAADHQRHTPPPPPVTPPHHQQRPHNRQQTTSRHTTHQSHNTASIKDQTNAHTPAIKFTRESKRARTREGTAHAPATLTGSEAQKFGRCENFLTTSPESGRKIRGGSKKRGSHSITRKRRAAESGGGRQREAEDGGSGRQRAAEGGGDVLPMSAKRLQPNCNQIATGRKLQAS